jgi:hypothetical protein
MKTNPLSKLMAALVLTSGAWTAQALADALPEARALIEGHIEAVGGREALEAQTDSILVGQFRMPAAGVQGRMTVASRAGGARVTVIELPGIGQIQSGYSADLAWSIDPFSGPRLIEGEELEALIERSELAAILRDPEYVRDARTVERTEFGGIPCFRVELSWKSGRTSHDCYAVDSGLMVAMETVETSPMGEFESLSLLGEYKDFHGVLAPSVTTVRSMGQDQIIEIDEVRLDIPDAALFELPPAIATLADSRN